MSKSIKIYGKKVDNFESFQSEIDSAYTSIQQTYLLESNRAAEGEVIEIEASDDDILHLKFEDEGEWIGPVIEIHKVFGKNFRFTRDGSDEFFPTSLVVQNGDRSFKEVKVKFLSWIKGVVTKVEEVVLKTLVSNLDNSKNQNIGLFTVGTTGKLTEAGLLEKGGKYLLFIHGTYSNFEDAFGNLFSETKDGIANQIEKIYGRNVLALQHHTLGVSPFQNAIDFLKEVNGDITLDIISHSRGGLIADIIESCSIAGDVYTNTWLEKSKENDKNLYKELLEINKLARKNKIRVEKNIRVAAPGNGTELLGHRLDNLAEGINIFFNALLNLIKRVFPITGKISNITYKLLRGFISDILAAKSGVTELSDCLPGIVSMVPESFPQKLFNRADVQINNSLIIITGKVTFGGPIGHTLFTILTNLFFDKDHDFVINTDSMSLGLRRKGGIFNYISNNPKTSHTHYFENSDSRRALFNALNTLAGQQIPDFKYLSFEQGSRSIQGDIADVLQKFSPIKREYKDVKGDKPIVILIPGIMGTHLSVNNTIIWADLHEIGNGRIASDLKIDSPHAIGTDLIIGNYYEKIIKNFEDNKFEVITLGYDWRSSLEKAALALKDLLIKVHSKAKKTISILAHSMGGLVVRDTMRLFPTEWSNYIKNKENRVILLGTPWTGSYLIMQVLTGHFKKVRQIAFVDGKNDRDELIKIFNAYPGIYELLPLNVEHKFENEDFWKDLNLKLGKDKINIPPASIRKHFSKYQDSINAFYKSLKEEDFENIYYIAGKDKETVDDFEIIKNFWGNKICYFGIPEGDGSVTWERGIPEKINKENNLYFAHNIVHGALANKEAIFSGIRELFLSGKTKEISTKPPIIPLDQRNLRSEEAIISNKARKPMDEPTISSDLSQIVENLLDLPSEFKIESGRKTAKIEVTMVHGDLRLASYPVVAGHFWNDAITDAEGWIDYYYNNKLSERAKHANYPGLIGDSLILFDKENQPIGAVIVGLGPIEKLTFFELMRTVTAGVCSYAMHFRDNVKDYEGKNIERTSLSFLCIGTGYGKLPLYESLNAILTGICQANEFIQELPDLKPIERIEFVEIYEEKAQNAYYQLNKLQKQAHLYNKLNFSLRKGLGYNAGARKKFSFDAESSWWHNFTTTLNFKENLPCKDKEQKKQISYLQFTSSAGQARVEVESTFTSQTIIQALLKDMAKKEVWDKTYSKTLFEILVPNSFKEIIRNQKNIIWKLDIQTASYPWELFHDYEFDNLPTFVRAGLIRQLYTEYPRPILQSVISESALVIASPLYTDRKYAPLPFAKKEGELVSQLLKAKSIETLSLIESDGLTIINELYNAKYRILHIAGHGVIGCTPQDTGVVLSNDMFITPAMISNFSRIPEFVFINCCYSGTILPGTEELYEDRYQFAANIGTELIKIGVRAVVVAGWPVNDATANLFAEILYKNMLEGEEFGDAVRIARSACYEFAGKYNNTWGAYQCYGDPFYSLVSIRKSQASNDEYYSEGQLQADLYNIDIDTAIDNSFKAKKPDFNRENQIKYVYDKLVKSIEKAKAADMYTPYIIEKEARILAKLNRTEDAIEKYNSLMHKEKADFTVSALEQICNLRIKYMENKLKDSANGNNSLSDALYTKKRKELIRLEKDFKNLLFIGETPERYSLLGSAYKRMAMMVAKFKRNPARKKIIQSYFIAAAKAYLDAYNLDDKSRIQKLVYPLQNFYIYNAIDKNSKLSLSFGGESNPIKVMDKIIKELKSVRDNKKDFWESISMVNIMEAQLFYMDTKEFNKQAETIITTYEKIWNQIGTEAHLQSEKEQIRSLKVLIENSNQSKTWKDMLYKTLDDLEDRFGTLKKKN